MENAEKVDVMGLRLSYGLSANTGLATNSSVVYRYNEVYRPGNTENGMVIEELENKDLTWEKNYQFNVGYDLTMFDGRLNFSLDYYNRQSFDLINLIKVSGIGGNMWKYANYCDLSCLRLRRDVGRYDHPDQGLELDGQPDFRILAQ